MDRDAHIAAITENGLALADAAAAAGLGAPVPSCPAWTVADLVWHTLGVHWFWGTVVAQRRQELGGIAALDRPGDDELLDQYREGVAILRAALETTPSETPVWTWAEPHDVSFVVRRMAQETVVHRWDAEHAAGRRFEVPVDLAIDGIDEFLHLFLQRGCDDAEPVGGTVHLHTTDVAAEGPGEWLVVPGDDGFTVTREHAKGACALRGAASDLLLVLWRRLPPEQVDVVGDTDVAARFVHHTLLD